LKKFLITVSLIAALAGAAFAQVPQTGHVFLVMEENHSYSSVIGNSSMPYFNSLAQKYGLATKYYANTHPSIGNYFMLTTGQIITNNDSYTGTVSANNLVRELISSGKTWKSYAESLPSVGYLGSSSPYAKKHNPFAFFTDVVNSSTEKLNLVPFTQLKTDMANGNLPDFSYIVPNMNNDAHNGTLGTADAWLKNNIGPVLSSSTFQQDGLMIIVFDESVDSDTTNGGGHIAMLVIGPKVKGGYKSTTTYKHQSTLRLIEQALGMSSFPGAAASAPGMGEFFGTSSTPPPPPPPSGTCAASGTGVTVCAPLSGTTVGSPVQFTAAAASTSAITAMKIYVDGTTKYSTSSGSLDTSLSLSSGSHSVTVKAWSSGGQVYSKSVSISVGTAPSPVTGTCTLNSTNNTVTICSPTNNSSVSSTVNVVAGSTSSYTVTAMQVYVDGVKKYEVSANKINTNLPLTTGTHKMTVKAWNTAGASFMSAISVTAQ
jgi:phosphatidylinositol-3-phosphatase